MSQTKVNEEDIFVVENMPPQDKIEKFDHGIVAGDYLSIINDDHYDYCKVTSVDADGYAVIFLAAPNTTLGEVNENPFETGIISTGVKADDGVDAYCVIDLTNPSTGVHDVGFSSAAFGVEAKAVQVGSMAGGYHTNAGGQYAITFGRETKAAYGCVAEGHSTQALEWYSHAEGMETKALRSASHAQGRNTIAGDKFAFASGYYTKALGCSSFSGGEYAETYGTGSIAFGTKTGNVATQANKDCSVAIGDGARANAQFSTAFGYMTDASEKCQFVVGKYNKITDPDYTGHNNIRELFIVGSGSRTTRKNALVVTSNDSIAVGNTSTGTAIGSISYGVNTKARVNYSLAGGNGADAAGIGAIAIGGTYTDQTMADGNYSIALGAGAQARGNFSLAQGYRTRSFADCQVAVGKYNTLDYNNTDNYWLFAVGDGGNAQRHNAFTVYAKTNTAKPRIKIGDTELSEEKLIALLALVN